jgi:agmatine/peptidylarginine deiminase
MKKLFSLLLVLISLFSFAQDLPMGFAPGEKEAMQNYLQSRSKNSQLQRGIMTPPAITALRTMGEWEEIQALCVTWTSYTSILREIVRYARLETKVIIFCSDSNTVKSSLTAGSVPLSNIKYVIAPYNSIWMRDYGANTVYGNQVDSLLLVDWIYNRPRPKDDTIPSILARTLGIPIYETALSPNDIIHTGGNFMADGFGTAFSSALTDQENPSKTSAQIDTVIKKFMGINRYIRFPVLPYDGIHHIDMHMKLLDEETLLVGQYPQGVSDGPQIEANLQYITSNFNSVYGSPYKIIRIPMPPDKNGLYPSQGGDYCTYTNAVFVNKSVILPTYYTQYDTTALRIWREALPGYQIIGIDCDNSSANIISASGAIHCITHSVGVNKPLLIQHHALGNTCDTINPYLVSANIFHASGINNAEVYYTTDTSLGFTSVPMSLVNVQNNTWEGFIPPQSNGKTVFYYISAQSASGKVIQRPLPAPKGFWKFTTGCYVVGISEESFSIKNIYPNPASAITCIPVKFYNEEWIKIDVINVLGQNIETVFEGQVLPGERNFFLFANKFTPGTYTVRIQSRDKTIFSKLMIR